MMEYVSSLLEGDEASLFHLANSVFLLIAFLTVFFLFVLLQQKELLAVRYVQETLSGVAGNTYVNVIYSENWEEEKLPVLMVIPGNPGGAGYYAEYLDLAVQECEEGGQEYRGCVVSHVGHSPPVQRVFNVKEQIDSKFAFITQKLQPGTKITLIGHSFGAYIALKLLEKGIKIEKGILLFPMFENMADMPKASHLRTMLAWKSYIILIARMTGFLPKRLKQKMIQFYANKFSRDIQDHMSHTICELIDPNSMNNVLGLAQSELAVINEPDYKLIRKHKERLVFYYGMYDLWAPLDCARRLRKEIPDVNFHIAEEDILHTFMFKSCLAVAKKTAELIIEAPKYDITNLIPTVAMVREAEKADDYDFCSDDED